MPRVLINSEIYFKNDLNQLIKIKMLKAGYNQKSLARELDITQPALSQKISKGSYTLDEFRTITKKLKFTDQEILEVMKWDCL